MLLSEDRETFSYIFLLHPSQFSNTLTPHFPISQTNQVSHPYKITRKITESILYFNI